ncbi:MAG: hypothetical protein IPH72_10655 [Sandaracinaceae bacterium]|nr:hypothetical protein [Sandaracinaceae bacterium]
MTQPGASSTRALASTPVPRRSDSRGGPPRMEAPAPSPSATVGTNSTPPFAGSALPAGAAKPEV